MRSAGILLWRRRDASGPGSGATTDVEVLIAHMGGPFWAGKETAAWSVPKGVYDDGEQPLDAAVREWVEELGIAVPVPTRDLVPLGEVRQPSGKRLTVWAGEGDLDPTVVVPGTFTMPWPPRSGKIAEFPEIDVVEWCTVEIARSRLVAGQRVFLDRLLELVG